jgi:hypothetical protein
VRDSKQGKRKEGSKKHIKEKERKERDTLNDIKDALEVEYHSLGSNKLNCFFCAYSMKNFLLFSAFAQ